MCVVCVKNSFHKLAALVYIYENTPVRNPFCVWFAVDRFQNHHFHHLMEKPYMCFVCDKRFSRINSLKFHVDKCCNNSNSRTENQTFYFV